MEAPKVNNSFWFSIFISIEALVFAVLTYYKLSVSWLICGLLIGLIICLVGLFTNFYICYKKFYESVKDISDKHIALSKEFDKKNDILHEYELTFANLSHIIIFAMTNLKDSDKIVYKNLFDFLSLHKQRISGVKRNE